jgi:AhpD family alkylhydroperoxidase
MEEFKHLDKKSLEIAAISASMAAVCQPCLQYHLDQAVKVGCTKDEINEAIQLGKLIRMSPEKEILRLAEKLLG